MKRLNIGLVPGACIMLILVSASTVGARPDDRPATPSDFPRASPFYPYFVVRDSSAAR